MSATITIASDKLLPNVERNFRIRAGPGAGKTYWLVQHIRNVLRHSNRLPPAARIACISYTNVAVGEIVQGLGALADKVEVSTIHSFLYRNVVKPYLFLVSEETGIEFSLVDGHDEHRPSYTRVRNWLRSIHREYVLKQNSTLFQFLRTMSWRRDQNTGKWHLKQMRRMKPPDYLAQSHFDSYKHFYWCDGIIDHDDVLYFACLILERFPSIRCFLSARFPYLFVDEFQDTNPIQTQVVKWLANDSTIVGLVGDPEQSIYAFQGARCTDFINLDGIPDLVDYKISDNRRSTDRITKLLNYMRSDGIQQEGVRGIEGEPVCVYVGEILDVMSEIKAGLPGHGDTLHTLARRNDDVAAARGVSLPKKVDFWEQFWEIDRERARLVEGLIQAGKALQLSRYDDAMRAAVKCVSKRNGKPRPPVQCGDPESFDPRRVAMALLCFIADNSTTLSQGTVLDAYRQFGRVVSDCTSGLTLTGVKGGKFQDFAQKIGYSDLENTASVAEDTREIRTIHQAKGAEFGNVLLWLSDPASLEYVLHPNVKRSEEEQEERRIVYVALSRARDKLFIAVPTLEPLVEKGLLELGIEVRRTKAIDAGHSTSQRVIKRQESSSGPRTLSFDEVLTLEYRTLSNGKERK